MTVTPNQLLVGEWLPAWLERRMHEGRKPIADSTSDRYRRVIATLPRSFAALRLQEVRPMHLTALYADESLTADARRKLHVVLRQAFMLAFRQELLSRNVMDAVSPPLVQKNAEQRVLNESELKALVAAAIGTAHQVPIKLTVATGLREGELLALTWSDVDLERGTLSVRRGAR
ncbi:MAG: tyrosine-type recombinase/integrase, partial [Chloroflexota bacterium]